MLPRARRNREEGTRHAPELSPAYAAARARAPDTHLRRRAPRPRRCRHARRGPHPDAGPARGALDGRHGARWMAVPGKPLAATAGAMIFERGGNAVDAACAMIAATSTMWDTLSWGGETQALIYNPNTGKVIGINALGVAPTGATPEFFHEQGMKFPPEFGPLAAVTPGTPGGLMTMLAEYGTMSLKQVLAPAIEMADGYPIEAELVHTIEKHEERIRQWPDARRVMMIHPGSAHEAPEPGELF